MILMATVLFAEGEKPGHHTKDGFQNYPAVKTGSSPGIEFIFKRIWASLFLPDVPDDHAVAPEIALKNIKAFGQENFITWIGQSTFLIQLERKMILTGPFFAEYAGVYSFGSRRFVPPKRFRQEAERLNISQNSLWIMKIGETRFLQGFN